jgi:hypothetical protein
LCIQFGKLDFVDNPPEVMDENWYLGSVYSGSTAVVVSGEITVHLPSPDPGYHVLRTEPFPSPELALPLVAFFVAVRNWRR